MPQLIKKRDRNRTPKNKIVVVYHKNCTDGFGAAWSAWKKFGSRADYIATDPRELPDAVLKNKDIYVVDNSFSREGIRRLLKTGNKITIIDHHVSSEKDVKSVPSHVFNINHSGAVLAWQYFHPEKKIPKLLLHIEDEDLWYFRLKNTKEIFAGLDRLKFEFKDWDRMVKKLENNKDKEKFVRQGKIILNYENKLVEQIAQNAELVYFCGYKTLAVNSPVLESQIGHYLYEKFPPMGIVWREKNGKKTFSLRSDGSVDVSRLAAKYGGGGHKASAGFALSLKERLPWKILKPSIDF